MLFVRSIIAIIVIIFIFTQESLVKYGSLTSYFLNFIGYFLVIFSVIGRTYSIVYLGGNKNSTLVNYGIYSVVRNPLYYFSFIGYLGISLQLHSIVIGVLLLITFLCYYNFTIAHEESTLKHNFGDKFNEYKSTVPKYFPKSLRHKIPESVTAQPLRILKTMIDSSLLFIVLPIADLVGYLHHISLLPVFYTII